MTIASLHRFVRKPQLPDYLSLGWLALPSLEGTHHGCWSAHVVWLCDCAPSEPREFASVRLGPESLIDIENLDLQSGRPGEQVETDARPLLTGPDKSIGGRASKSVSDDMRERSLPSGEIEPPVTLAFSPSDPPGSDNAAINAAPSRELRSNIDDLEIPAFLDRRGRSAA
jgi:hypothetical protein